MDDYFSIKGILAQEEKVPVTCGTDIHKCGFLDPGSVEEDLKSGTRTDVPYWLGKLLCTKVPNTKLDLPKAYAHKWLGNLKVDAMSVPLGSNPNFYDIGLELADLLPTTSASKLLEILLSALAERYKIILDKSQNMRNTDLTEFTRKLTTNEKKLFEAGYEAVVEFERWKEGMASKITASQVLPTRSNKRKREGDT